MLTRTKLKNLIYKKVEKLTSQKFHDESWEGVTQMKNAIQSVINENEGGYYFLVIFLNKN